MPILRRGTLAGRAFVRALPPGWLPQTRLRSWLLHGAFQPPVNTVLCECLTTRPRSDPPACPGVRERSDPHCRAALGFLIPEADFLFAALARRTLMLAARAPRCCAALWRTYARLSGGVARLRLPARSSDEYMDAMRISSDVDVGWTPSYRGQKFSSSKGAPHMPSARNALQNVLCRLPLHQRWSINDATACCCTKNHLTLEEIRTQASVTALSGGSLFLSDDLPALRPNPCASPRACSLIGRAHAYPTGSINTRHLGCAWI